MLTILYEFPIQKALNSLDYEAFFDVQDALIPFSTGMCESGEDLAVLAMDGLMSRSAWMRESVSYKKSRTLPLNAPP